MNPGQHGKIDQESVSGTRRPRKRQRQKDVAVDGDYRHEEGDANVDDEGGGDDSEEERIVGDLNSHISFTIETKDKSEGAK